jgi:hypothetical protein
MTVIYETFNPMQPWLGTFVAVSRENPPVVAVFGRGLL